jgi:hypothetical protein
MHDFKAKHLGGEREKMVIGEGLCAGSASSKPWRVKSVPLQILAST